jgi:hypothetical protein
MELRQRWWTTTIPLIKNYFLSSYIGHIGRLNVFHRRLGIVVKGVDDQLEFPPI